MTVAWAIGFAIKNLPAVFLVVALIAAASTRGRKPAAEHFLAWILLLPIGATGLWAGIAHAAFPEPAAAHIGWQTSPFQWEVGMADLAIGITACLAFWAKLPFKTAAVTAASVFLLGDAVGHVRQMLAAGNFEPGNAGLPFYMDVLCPVLAIVLLLMAGREPETFRHGG